MKNQLLSPSSFFRLPWIAWNAPPAIISDMSGPTCSGCSRRSRSAARRRRACSSRPATITLPDGEEGLTVSEEARRADVARFMSG